MKIKEEKLLKSIIADPLLSLHRVSRERETRVREPYTIFPINRHGEKWRLLIAGDHSPRKIDEHLVMKLLWAPGLKQIEQILLGSRPLDNSEIGKIIKVLLFSNNKIKSSLTVEIIDLTLKWFPQLTAVNLSLERFKTYEPILFWHVNLLTEGPPPLEPRRIGVGYKDKGSLSGPSLPGEFLMETKKEQLDMFESILLKNLLSHSLF